MVIGTPTVLNLIPGGVMKVIHVNQVNENIEIQFRIMNGAQPFNVPEGVSCTIRGTKGDNFGYAADVAVTAGSNIVTVTLTEQLTAVAGAGNIFELVFVGASDDMKVSTENFILDVERAALGEDTVVSDSDLAYADQVLNQLQSVGAVNAQVQQNKANIAAEITRATAAEQTLQQNINAEAAARQAADNTLQSNINAEASSRATTDASLQSQINQLVAPSGEAPSAAEVENARIGSDGTVYPTLGDAIRTQNSLLKSHLEATSKREFQTVELRLFPSFASRTYTGGYYNDIGGWTTADGYTNWDFNSVPYDYDVYFVMNSPLGYVQCCVFNGSISRANFVARYRFDDNNMPSKSNPLTVKSGQVLAITMGTAYGSPRFTTTTNWHGDMILQDPVKENATEDIIDFTVTAEKITQDYPFKDIYVGYSGNTLGLEVVSGFTTYGFVVNHNTDLYVINHNTAYFAITVFTSENLENGARYRYVSGGEDTLPTADSPLALTAGNYIMFTVRTDNKAFTVNLSASSVPRVQPFVLLSQNQIDQVLSNIDTSKAVKVRYDNTVEGREMERLYIYVHSGIGYVRYNFAHFISTLINSNCWLIHPVYAVDDTLAARYEITTSGEWECAIKISGAPDFMGGSEHGSEINTDIHFFIDGAEVQPSAITNLTDCNEVRVIEKSNLYDPTDETTIVATHGKEYIWTKEGLTINQSVVWQTARSVDPSYMAMFPVTKAVSDYLCTNDAFTTYAFTDGYVSGSHIDSVLTWSDPVGFLGSFNIPRWDIEGNSLTGVGNFLSTDNNGEDYNKMYYVCATGGTVSQGDRWRTQTKYKLEVNK